VSPTPGLQILAGPLRGGGALVRDYIDGVDLAAFFEAHPTEAGAFERKASEVDARLDAAARARVASAIEPLGDAGERLRRILSGDGFFVTTGQQPALFGGPLYTLYKVLAAIRLAEALEQRLARPVLALFWIGSDDHDWAEANHATIPDASGYPLRITVRGGEDAPPLPLSERVWGGGIKRAVTDLIEQLPSGDYAAAVADHVHASYTADATVAASFTATIRFLLGAQRLAVVDSAHPQVRRAAAPVLRRDIEHAADHAARTSAQTARLTAAGYSAQVTVPADAANVMVLDDHGRDRLVRAGSGWTTRRRRHAMAEAELLQRLDAEPDRFSPNVLLRPVVESSLFPTLAYVAGPGEVSYFAQIGELFRAHGIMPPVVVPRPSVTLVDPAVARVLERLGMTAADVDRPFEVLLTDVIRQHLPDGLQAALASVRESLLTDYERLIDEAMVLDPTLRGPLTSARNDAIIGVHRAERRIITHLKRRNEVLTAQLRRAAAAVLPFDVPQERVLNVLPFAARWGAGLIADIEASLDTAMTGRVLATIARARIP
jgi:bacillithiol synthase